MTPLNITLERINTLTPEQIVSDEHVRAKFISIYEAMWSGTTGLIGAAAYEREARNFSRLLAEKEDIRSKCSRFSIFTAFLDVAISGLSLEPGTRAQAYLQSRSVAVDSRYENGAKKNVYETQCMLVVSGYGELILRARCGQIRHADNPVIVYAEDEFEFGERNGNKFVNYTCRLPHTSGNIVGCFMKITRADGTRDYAVMLPEDWVRLARYSARSNGTYDRATKEWKNAKPNALYGQQADGSFRIDPGFLIAKCIKHAFKSYPKARVGRGTQLESQQVDEVEINDGLYSLEDGTAVDTATGEVGGGSDTGFAPAADISAGVVIDVEAGYGAGDDVF